MACAVSLGGFGGLAAASPIDEPVRELIAQLGQLLSDSGTIENRELRVLTSPSRLQRALGSGAALPRGTLASGNELRIPLGQRRVRLILEIA